MLSEVECIVKIYCVLSLNGQNELY